jgi:hypothetical protein
MPAPLTNACRDFARQVLDLLQIPIRDNARELSPGLGRNPAPTAMRPVALAA